MDARFTTANVLTTSAQIDKQRPMNTKGFLLPNRVVTISDNTPVNNANTIPTIAAITLTIANRKVFSVEPTMVKICVGNKIPVPYAKTITRQDSRETNKHMPSTETPCFSGEEAEPCFPVLLLLLDCIKIYSNGFNVCSMMPCFNRFVSLHGNNRDSKIRSFSFRR